MKVTESSLQAPSMSVTVHWPWTTAGSATLDVIVALPSTVAEVGDWVATSRWEGLTPEPTEAFTQDAKST